MNFRLQFALLCLLAVCACAPQPMVRDEDPVDPINDRIAMLIASGDYEEALTVVEGLLGGLSEADQAGLQLRAAEHFLAARRAMEARRLLDRLRPVDLRGYDGLRLTLARAELALLDRDPDTATWLLDQIADQVPGSLQPRLQSLRQRLGQPGIPTFSSQIEDLTLQLQGLEPDPELVLSTLIEAPLIQIEALMVDPAQPLGLLPWIDLAATARAALLDPERLASDLAAWETRHPDVDYSAEQALEWLKAWRQLQTPPQRIALLLPGPESALARPGAAIRNGVLSSWLRLPISQRPELLFFNLSDAPGAAVNAWYAAREANADQVIGPLARAQVEQLIDLGDASVPALFLNHPNEIGTLSRFPGLATAYALNPEGEAELAATRALLENYGRALVLHPDNDWGERVSTAFTTIFQAGDGKILRDMAYPPGQPDYSVLLEVLLELDQSEQRGEQLAAALGTSLEVEPSRRTDVDIIFLAARADDARALRPQLKFFDAGDLPVFSTSHALGGAPDPRRAKDLDGLVLPLAPWFSGDGQTESYRQQAERHYPDLANPTLSQLFAMGSDVFDLLPWLGHMNDDPDLYLAGLTGRLRIIDSRMVERDLPFVRIVDGLAVPE
jgi:outer membrane PBP1 activator LpoA protein